MSPFRGSLWGELITQKEFILASQSPRRRGLMEKLKFPFRAVAPEFVEIAQPDLSPEQEVLALARGKALSLASRFPNALILGCDTLVVLGEKKLGKPCDPAEALWMLRLLSGKTHRVLTGLYLLDSNHSDFKEAVEETHVTMRVFSEEEARAYVATGEPLDKAGAYGIQGKGGALVKSLQGDFDNVVGLPLGRLASLLKEFKIPLTIHQPPTINDP